MMGSRRAMRVMAVSLLIFSLVLMTPGMPSVLGNGPEESSWSTFRGDSRRTGLSDQNASMNQGGLQWSRDFKEVFTWRDSVDGSLGGSGIPVVGRDGTVYCCFSKTNTTIAVSPEGSVLWSFDMGSFCSSELAPAVSDEGIVYVAAAGSLFAIWPNGTLGWRCDVDGTFTSNPAIGGDGTVYIGCDDECLHAIGDNGQPKWAFETNETVRSSPVVSPDGSITFMARIGNETHLVSLYQNGSRRWSIAVPDGYSTMSPCVRADGSVLVFDRADNLLCYHSNGTLDWTSPIVHTEPGFRARVRPLEVAIGPDGTIYSGSLDALYALTPEGALKWRMETVRRTYSPIVSSDGTVFVVVYGTIYAVDCQGDILWHSHSDWYDMQIGIPREISIGLNGSILFMSRYTLYSVNGMPPMEPAVEEDDSIMAAWFLTVGCVVLTVIASRARKSIRGRQGVQGA